MCRYNHTATVLCEERTEAWEITDHLTSRLLRAKYSRCERSTCQDISPFARWERATYFAVCDRSTWNETKPERPEKQLTFQSQLVISHGEQNKHSHWDCVENINSRSVRKSQSERGRNVVPCVNIPARNVPLRDNLACESSGGFHFMMRYAK